MTKLTKDSKTNLEIAKKASMLCFQQYPVLQQLTLAQAILESGLRNSPPSSLALVHCNLFGMKPGRLIARGTDGIVYLPTKECDKYHCWTEKQPFLANNNIEDSFDQHEKLFRNLSRYSALLRVTTFAEAAKVVKDCGYATDPKYPAKLIEIYKQFIEDKKS